jgi:hypothetical protein
VVGCVIAGRFGLWPVAEARQLGVDGGEPLGARRVVLGALKNGCPLGADGLDAGVVHAFSSRPHTTRPRSGGWCAGAD